MTLQVSIYTVCVLSCFLAELDRSIGNTKSKGLTRERNLCRCQLAYSQASGPPRCGHLRHLRDEMHDLILAGVGTELIAIEPAVVAFPLHSWSQGIVAKRAVAHVADSFSQ